MVSEKLPVGKVMEMEMGKKQVFFLVVTGGGFWLENIKTTQCNNKNDVEVMLIWWNGPIHHRLINLLLVSPRISLSFTGNFCLVNDMGQVVDSHPMFPGCDFFPNFIWQKNLDGWHSKNRGGPPKWMGMVYNGKPENPIKIDDLGVLLFLETPRYRRV